MHTFNVIASTPSIAPARLLAGIGVTAALALLCSAPAPVRAALGDTETSVSTDMARFKASRRITTHGSFTVHQLQTAENSIIREYISPAGAVFAVSWQGPYKPSMRLLLGPHFDHYASAPRTAGSTRSQLRIDQPNLVVHAVGHIRYFAGVAFVPQLMPADVTEKDLQ